MSEIKIGTIIELEGDALAIAKSHSKEDKANQFMMQYASRLTLECRERFWKSIFEFYPELENYNSVLDHETSTITVLSKR